MARLIDVDALKTKAETIQTIDYWHMRTEEQAVLVEHIDNAPTIDAVPQWIPCKDGMPKKEIPYQRRGYYLTTNAYGNVDLTRYEFEDDFQKTGWQSDILIVAWMPLPKPYAERKDHE